MYAKTCIYRVIACSTILRNKNVRNVNYQYVPKRTRRDCIKYRILFSDNKFSRVLQQKMCFCLASATDTERHFL